VYYHPAGEGIVIRRDKSYLHFKLLWESFPFPEIIVD
jgi:hypothetical protein